MYTKGEAVQPPQRPTNQPPGWSRTHVSAWERVRDAFRRDWNQTQADFTGGLGHDLNQTATDTLKQAVGPGGVPPLSVKTHPDTPSDIEIKQHHLFKDMKAQTQKVTSALRSISHEEAALRETLLDTDAAAFEEQRETDSASLRTRNHLDQKAATPGVNVTAERQLATAWSAEATAAIARNTELRVAEATARAAKRIKEDRDEVTKGTSAREAAAERWRALEPAARYGFTAHSQHPWLHAWSEQVEEALSAEWRTVSSGASWEAAKDDIRRGWEYADKEVDAEPADDSGIHRA